MLDALVKYARDHNIFPEPGFKPKRVRWNIVFDQEGNYLDVHGFGDEKNPGKEFPKCPDLSQPEIKRGGPGCRHFLIDNAEVVVLLGLDSGNPKIALKQQQKHNYFINLLRKGAVALPELSAVVTSLENTLKIERIRESLLEKGAKKTDAVSFSIFGRTPAVLVEDSSWHDWWREFRGAFGKDDTDTTPTSKESHMRCLASGKLVEPVRTWPKVRGLADVGGIASGDVLASFKQDSFRSYGLEQSLNASVSEEMAHALRATLDNLLEGHSRRLAGMRVIHWYSGRAEVPPDKDPILLLDNGLHFLSEQDNPEQTERDAQKRAGDFLDSLRTGDIPDLIAYRYYMLALSGASGRIMVRDWMEGQFGELATNIWTWFDDLSIVRSDGNGLSSPPKFMAVLGGMVRDLKELPNPLVGGMWRTAVKNEPIPIQAVARVLERMKVKIIKSDKNDPVYPWQPGLIKAYHIRRKRGDGSMTPYLNEEHPHPAYHCGRLMAVLADLQYAAQGDVGAGIIQRYYASASSTPALVLGRLVRLSQVHLSKLDGGLAHWYETRIASIWGAIRDNVPAVLSLEEQSLFALGYYQQKAQKKSNDKPAQESK